MNSDSQTDRLESWKAIARYLKKSVRTARRWEAEEGLPVHRQMHKSQGTVYAFPEEIDAWRRRMERRSLDKGDDGTTDAAPGNPETRPDRSIAVLPFQYLGRDPASAYIADGFTEEIITGLSRIRALRVISWTSSMTFRDNTRSAPVIGRELGVDLLVEGTVRHEGPRLRVAARLVHAETDDRVWSHTYEGNLDELFAIQDSIAGAVVDYLNLRHAAAVPDQDASRPTDIAAWQFLVKARQASLRWRKDSIDQAVQLLLEGLRVAGDDPRLYAALGRTYLHYREAGIDLSDMPLDEAENCAARAFELQPGLAAGQQLKGWLHYARGEVQAAVDRLRQALAAEPGDPDTLSLLANCYLISGRPVEARPLIEKLTAIDPLTPLTRCMPGWAVALEGDFESAIEPYRDMYRMDPDNPMARLFYVFILAGAGQSDEARDVADTSPQPIRETLPGKITARFGSALAGDDALSLSASDAALLTRGSDVLPRFLAQAYALAGDAGAAVEWMQVAVDKGFINYPFMSEHDPFLTPLIGEPAYDALLADVRQRWESFRP